MRAFALTLLILTMPSLAMADQTMTVIRAYAFDTSPGMANGVAYLELRNDGPSEAHLTGLSTDISEFSQVHTHIQDGDLRRMVAMDLPITLQPGETLVMEPGGIHLMFLGLEQPLTIGDTINLTLHLEGAHTKDLDMNVEIFGIDMHDKLIGQDGENHNASTKDTSNHTPHGS